MNTEDIMARLVSAIHASNKQLVLAVTGAGTQSLMELQTVPGCSNTLLEGVVPYSKDALKQYVNENTKTLQLQLKKTHNTKFQHVSTSTAQRMAGRALLRARELSSTDVHRDLLGISCTAAVVTTKTKKGEHRACISARSLEGLTTYYIGIEKGAGDRKAEEQVVSHMILNTIAKECGIDKSLRLPVDCKELEKNEISYRKYVEQLLAGGPSFMIDANGDVGTLEETKLSTPHVILPGSFNPLHDGHKQLLEAAQAATNYPSAFEFTAKNAAKGSVDVDNILTRLAQFAGKSIVVTNAPTYAMKAMQMPNTNFVVGYDTAIRIIQNKYYNNSDSEMEHALLDLASKGCSFLVAGRAVDGSYKTCDDITFPEYAKAMFSAIPEDNFRLDISSTELRRKAKK